jgi:hypothetical protein
MWLLYDIVEYELGDGENVKLANVITEKAREANGNVSAGFRYLYPVELKRLLHSSTKYLHAAMHTREPDVGEGVQLAGDIYGYYFVIFVHDR